MSRAQRQRLERQVRRTFAANRMAQTHLEAAYAQIVPIHIRIVSRRPLQTVMKNDAGEPTRREGRAA